VTVDPGITVIVAGEKLVPAALTIAFDGLGGVEGFAGGFVAGSVMVGPSTAAPPPPHATVANNNMKRRLPDMMAR
jgi:hypothetical protein